jgi:hypothetical protein
LCFSVCGEGEEKFLEAEFLSQKKENNYASESSNTAWPTWIIPGS